MTDDDAPELASCEACGYTTERRFMVTADNGQLACNAGPCLDALNRRECSIYCEGRGGCRACSGGDE